MKHKKKIWLSTALATILFISVAFAADFYKFGYTGAEMETLFDRMTTASGETGIIICDGAGTFSGITTSAGLRGQISDETGTGAAVFGTSPTLGTPTLTSPVLDGNITGTAFLDEDDMSSDSATSVASQQSIKAHIADGNVTMTNKTLTSPVINTGVSGTAILDEDDMASDSNTKLATQQSIKAYIDSSSVTPSNAVTFSNKNFSQNGTVTITDIGDTVSENALNVFAPNLSDGGAHRLRFGVSADSYNSGTLSFDYTGTGSASNYFALGVTGVGDVVKVYGSGNTVISGTSEITDTLTLSKASGTGLSVTSDIDFNAIASGATKVEINTTCDGNTATAAEIVKAADGIGVTIPRQLIVSIGDWNMNSTASVTVAHGLTGSKIKSVTGSFRNDTGNGFFPITSGKVQDSGVYAYQVYINNWDATSIYVYRGSSTYEAGNAEYDGTGFSRGELIVSYID
jgi:hypothetical protein